MFILLIVSTFGAHTVTVEYRETFPTLAKCEDAIVEEVAPNLVPQTNGMIRFRCVEQGKKS